VRGVGSYWVGLAALFVGYVALAGWLPPADDEIYYWCWAKNLQPSYFDHPPMTALLTRASISVFGDSVTAVRLPACVASVVVLGVLGWITRPRHLLAWVILTPIYTFGAVVLTPDTPLLLFWALYLGWLTWVHVRLDEGRPIPFAVWLLGGLILGCDGLGKYTAVLAVPSGFLSFLLARGVPPIRWVPGYVFHGVVAGLMVVPVFAFNVEHDFAPMLYQLRHAAGDGGTGGVRSLLEFVGVQVLLFGTLPLLLLPWTWVNCRTLTADPRLRAAACLYAGPFTFFLVKAATGPLEGNWALASYLGFWPVAACWAERWVNSPARQWFVRATFAIPVGCVAVLAVHMIHPIPLLPPRHDRISRQWVKLEVAERAAELAKMAGRPVYCPWYQWVALLRYYGADARQLDGVTRPSNFTLTPDVPDADVVYIFTEGPLPPTALPEYDPKFELIENILLTVRGETTNQHQFLRFTRRPEGLASVSR
jgi:4-amino-4-deoxy-L-arabinose transferase-like glycosyltransferase